MTDFEPIPALDRFIATLGATIIYVESEFAYYMPFFDLISVPPRGSRDTGTFYAAMLHEHAHWTGHWARLRRAFGWSPKDLVYAREELIAIVATLHLCAFFDLPPLSWSGQLDYADTFIPTVQTNASAMRYAVREGRRAALYLHGLQGHTPPPHAVLFQSVNALATMRFSSLMVSPSAERAPVVGRSPLAPLIERFRTVRRVPLA
jgi:antirestriction protein ArdC